MWILEQVKTVDCMRHGFSMICSRVLPNVRLDRFSPGYNSTEKIIYFLNLTLLLGTVDNNNITNDKLKLKKV